MPTFQPKSEKELRDLLPAGKYQGQVTHAEEKVAKSSGAPMIEIRVEIYDDQNRRFSVLDRLVFSESMMWKLHSFCKSAGIMDRYEAGDVQTTDCLDRMVHCNVVQKEEEGYDPKNEIKSYFVPKEAAPKRQPEGVSDKQRSAANKGKTEGEDCPF